MNAHTYAKDKSAIAAAIAESIKTTSLILVTVTNDFVRIQTDEDTVLSAVGSDYKDINVVRKESTLTETQRRKGEDALHFARKHEGRVWGSGGDHEKARAEVERLEVLLSDTWDVFGTTNDGDDFRIRVAVV
jgi:hypothetical protein